MRALEPIHYHAQFLVMLKPGRLYGSARQVLP